VFFLVKVLIVWVLKVSSIDNYINGLDLGMLEALMMNAFNLTDLSKNDSCFDYI
jgi:hypothetical protein